MKKIVKKNEIIWVYYRYFISIPYVKLI